MTVNPLSGQQLRAGDWSPSRPPDPRPASRPESPEPEPGLVGADPPRTTDEARQDLSAGLPPDVALLEVIPSRVGKEDCFQLSMSFRNGEPTGSSDPRELRNQRRPDRVLADELDGRISEAAAVSYYRYLRTWSVGKERLTRWLTMLRTEVPAGLRLIIYDLTNFSIPWELFWHDMEEDPQWLGVAVQVIRWTTVRDERLPLQFRTVADEPVGSEILYHEASGDCGKLPPRYSISHNQPSGWYKAAATMQELLDYLNEGTARYGLVYVFGHGRHSSHASAASLAGVRLDAIQYFQLPVLRASRSVVILNVCNSARPVRDKTYRDDVNRSFVEFFLRQGATAVVSMMGEVPVIDAVLMAKELIEQARDEGVRLPEHLRKHRAARAARLPRAKLDLAPREQDAIRAFLYASVFAYFGNVEYVFRLAQK